MSLFDLRILFALHVIPLRIIIYIYIYYIYIYIYIAL